MPPLDINLGAGERVFICGKTGSGKTTLAKEITRGLRRLVVCDSKGTLTNWRTEEWGRETQQALRDGESVRVRVTPPLEGDESFWNDIFKFIFEVGELTVYIDELFAIVPEGKRPPPLMGSLWTRGREFGIGAWAATQRPSWIPGFTMSEAEHYFMFRLLKQIDRARMTEFMGDGVNEPIRDPHGFYYMAASSDGPVYVSQLDLGERANGRKD